VRKVKDFASIMAQFSIVDYFEMIISYGMAGQNARAAARNFMERFPGRGRYPSYNVIDRCVRRARETGFLLPNFYVRLKIIPAIACVVQLVHSDYANQQCIVLYVDTTYIRIIFNECNNCCQETMNDAFTFAKVQ